MLREEVLRGQYRAGERLPSERDLASRFETTRGVVRVALKKLEQLGLADVQPGGARVIPISEASLDVVPHLMELEDPPPPELVDQILEVLGALMAANTRIAVERGRSEQLARALELIDRLRKSEDEEGDGRAWVHELSHVFIDASDNMVMHMVRRGLRTHLFDGLRSAGLEVSAPGEPPAAPSGLPSPSTWVRPHAEELARAVEQRDGLAAYEAFHRMWTAFRAGMRRTLEAARLDRAGEGAQ